MIGGVYILGERRDACTSLILVEPDGDGYGWVVNGGYPVEDHPMEGEDRGSAVKIKGQESPIALRIAPWRPEYAGGDYNAILEEHMP